MTDDPSGFAFPHQFEDVTGNKNWRQSQGMTLRDWFAGHVLSGFVQRPSYTHADAHTAARFSYLYADAMLAERSK